MQDNNADLNNNGIPDKFEYQESSDLANFKPQGNAFDNAYTSEEQIAKNIPDYKSYQWYREPNEGYFYSYGQKLENKIESGEITPEQLPEGSGIQKEAKQLYDNNPYNDEVNNEEIEKGVDEVLKKANKTENPLRVYRPESFYRDNPVAENADDDYAYPDYVKKGDKYFDPRNESVSIFDYPSPQALVYDTLSGDISNLDIDLLGYDENTPLPKKIGDNKATYEFIMNSPFMQKYMNYYYDAVAANARREHKGIEDKEGYIQRFIDFCKDTLENGVEEAIENNPDVAEQAMEIVAGEDSPIETEAEQLNDSNPYNDEVNNEKIEKGVDEVLKKANKTENPLRVYRPRSSYKVDTGEKDEKGKPIYEDTYDPGAKNAYEDYVKKGDKYFDPRNGSVRIFSYPSPQDLVYDTLTDNIEDLDIDLLGYEKNTRLPKKLGDNKATYEFIMNSPYMQKYMNYFDDAAAAEARRVQKGIEDKEGYIQRFIDFCKDTLEGGVEEAIENNPDVAEQVMEVVAGEDSPIETEAEQLNDSNPHNDEVNNKALDDEIEEKTKEIGSFLPAAAFDFTDLVNSVDDEKTEKDEDKEEDSGAEQLGDSNLYNDEVIDDIKKDIDNEEDLFWFEQLTQKAKKEKRADKKRKREENKRWIENQTSEDLDAIKEGFGVDDTTATMSGDVPAEIYDNENFGGKVGPWNSAVGPARNLSGYKDAGESGFTDEELKVVGESWLTDDEIDDIVEESSPNADEETKERRRKILRKFRLATIKANPNFPDVNSTKIKSKENPGIKSGVHPSKFNASGSSGAGGSVSGMKISLPKEKESNYKSKTGGGDIEVEVPEKTNTAKFSGSSNSIHRSEHLSQTMDKIGKSAGVIKTGSSSLSGKEGHTSSGKAGKVPFINKNLNVASIREKIIGLSKGWPMEKGYRYSGPKYLPFKFWVKDDTVELVQVGTGRHRQSLESFIKKEPGALQQLMGALR